MAGASKLVHSSSYDMRCNLLETLSDAQRAQYLRARRRSTAYRISLCRYWKNGQSCKYGNNCSFAHGVDELRSPPPQHPKYKTQLCKNFIYNGICEYGKRCNFIHRQSMNFVLPSAFQASTSAAGRRGKPSWKPIPSSPLPYIENWAPPSMMRHMPSSPIGFESPHLDEAAAEIHQQHPSPPSSPIDMAMNNNNNYHGIGGDYLELSDFIAKVQLLFANNGHAAANAHNIADHDDVGASDLEDASDDLDLFELFQPIFGNGNGPFYD